MAPSDKSFDVYHFMDYKEEREREKERCIFKEKRNACNIWTKKGEREKGIIPIRIQCKQHTLLGMKLHCFIVVNFLFKTISLLLLPDCHQPSPKHSRLPISFKIRVRFSTLSRQIHTLYLTANSHVSEEFDVFL